MQESKQFVFIGISCAYSDSSGRVTTECSGLADKESNTPVDETTVFPACSISKFITALCVMKACEQDLIHIDAPVNNYLSRWKLRTSDGSESDASIRSLLYHAAGIIDGEDGFYGLRRTDPVISLTDILDGKTAYNNRPARTEKAPGTEFEYSDAGYCILQMLIEDVTQNSFEAFAAENFFAPLGLRSTFFASPKNLEVYEKKYVLATGYDENGMPVPGKYPQVPDLAASGLWSTPKELLILAQEFYKAYNGKSSLLKESSAREMAKPAEKFSWTGLGVFMGSEHEIQSRGWGENGQCMLRINYVTGDSAVVMTNQNPGVDQAASGIEDLAAHRAATRKRLASVAKTMAQTPFHGFAEGEGSNLEPIVTPFPGWTLEEADGLWCAAFVYFCCTKAGFDIPIRPGECKTCHLTGCIAWEEFALGDPRIEYHTREDAFVPEAGDIVLYDHVFDDHEHDHIGIIIEKIENSLLAAEGNVSNRSGIIERPIDEHVRGYIRIPDRYQYRKD